MTNLQSGFEYEALNTLTEAQQLSDSLRTQFEIALGEEEDRRIAAMLIDLDNINWQSSPEFEQELIESEQETEDERLALLAA